MKKLLYFFFGLVGLAALSVQAQTTEMPAMMILEGKVIATSDGKLSPTTGDVLAVVDGSGKELGRTTVADGTYSGLVLTLSLADNGKLLAMRYIKGNTTYGTYAGKEGDQTFNFSGSVFPVRSSLDILMTTTVISGGSGTGTGSGTGSGSGTGTGTGSGTGSGSTTTKTGDVNGDGKVDETDIDILRSALTGQRPVVLSTMDVTKDGVFNTRDVIVVLQIIRTSRRLSASTVAGASTSTTGATTTGSGTSSTTTTSRSGSPAVQTAKTALGR